MDDEYERETFHSKLPKSWKIPNKTHTSLIKVERNANQTNLQTSERNKIENLQNKPKRKISLNFLLRKASALAAFSFKMAVLSTMFYIFYQIISTVKNDLRIRIDQEYSKLKYLIEDSSYKYMINKCDIVDIPAMKRDCMEWKANMGKSRRDIPVIAIVMDYFGNLVDKFLDQISWKFFTVLLAILIFYYVFIRHRN